MTWQCRLIEWVPGLKGDDLQIGDMWFHDPKTEDPDHHFWFDHYGRHLSDYYYANNSGRLPLFVWVPGRTPFCVDSKCWSNGNYYGGWTVTGEAPNITVQPSINIGGSYHGYLTNGVLGTDVEGRTYAADGRVNR